IERRPYRGWWEPSDQENASHRDCRRSKCHVGGNVGKGRQVPVELEKQRQWRTRWLKRSSSIVGQSEHKSLYAVDGLDPEFSLAFLANRFGAAARPTVELFANPGLRQNSFRVDNTQSQLDPVVRLATPVHCDRNQW